MLLGSHPPSPSLQLGLAGVGLRGLDQGASCRILGRALGFRAAAFGGGGVDPAAGGVRWVLQDVPSAAWAARWRRLWGLRGSPDLRPYLKMAAPPCAAHHISSSLECLGILQWLVGGAGDGSDEGKPLAAGGRHDVDGAAGVLLLPEGTSRSCSPEAAPSILGKRGSVLLSGSLPPIRAVGSTPCFVNFFFTASLVAFFSGSLCLA